MAYNSNSPNQDNINPNYPLGYPNQTGMNPNYPMGYPNQPGMNPNYPIGMPNQTFPLAAGGNYPYQPGIPQYNPTYSQMPPPQLNYSNPNFNPVNGYPPPMGYGDMRHPLSHNSSFSGPIPSAYPNTYMNPQIQNTDNMANVVERHQLEEELRNHEQMQLYKEKRLLEEQSEEIHKAFDRKDEPAVPKTETREERNKKRVLRFRNGNLNDTPIKISVPRSEYFYERDRYFLEQLIMQPLKVNGAFGKKIVEDYDKRVLIGENELEQSSMMFNRDNDDEYFEKSVKDGIYLDYIKQLIYSFNIQKIEQRAAREGKKEWFTSNGDLRMDNDIFSDVITKPTDITLTANEQFNTYYGNSAFSGRNTESMLKTYKLRLIISKVIFTKHPVFNKEEQLNAELRELHRDYYKHMNMLNIPYLKDKIITIGSKLDDYARKKLPTEAEKVEIKNMRIFLNEATEYLQKEKTILNQKANALYDKWLELKRLRIDQKYQSTRSKLSVIRFDSVSDNPNMFDYAFILTNHDVSGDPAVVPRSEFDRREKVKSNNCYLKIYINGVFVLETKKVCFSWPSYEVEFNSLFLINLYTRPTKMEVEVYVNKDLVSKFEAEPPGIFSKTVTSSSSLMEEIEFGKVQTLKNNNKGNQQQQQQQTQQQQVSQQEQQQSGQDEEGDQLLNNNKNEPQEKDKNDNGTSAVSSLVEGRLLLKTEWEGLAPDLPPTKIEDKLELVNRQIEFKEEIKRYNAFDYPFDVNDPRNVAFVEEMKKGRLELMLKFLYKEYLLNYYDVASIRHYLLLKRLEKKSLSSFTFPILEHEIERDPKAKEILDELKKEDRSKLSDEDIYEQTTQENIERLQQEYSGRILTNEEYAEFLKKKVKIMRKDITHQNQYNYFQIISEAEIYDDPVLLIKEFFIRVFSRARKLAPLKIKPPPVKAENIKSFKINVHVVKGYNLPIRIDKIPTKIIDSKRRNMNFSIGNDTNNSYRPTLPMDYNQSRPMDTLHGSYVNPHYPGSMGNNPNLSNQMYNPNMMNDMRGNVNNRDKEKVRELMELENKVNSFIEVKILFYDQEGIFRTDAVNGIHPDYNYQIEFEIKPRKGEEYFNTSELAKCPGVFYFTIYDEVRRDTLVKTKDANTFTQRFEKKYLGSFSIPFSTVFQNASILDTICKVDIPKIVFGYYSDTSSLFDVTKDEQEEQQKEPQEQKEEEFRLGRRPLDNDRDAFQDDIPRIVNPFIHSYVSLYITLDPIPSFTKNDDLDYVPGYEDSIFLINATKWLRSIKDKAMYKNRNIRLFAENFDGYSIFMPRYLRKEGQKPPDFIFKAGDENAIEMVSRYVALIPFIEDSQTFDFAEEMPDCWCTDNQFLTLGFGDYEEHAVLLCNYFNYVDLQKKTGCVSYLALGTAHPEGLTIYVMRISQDSKKVEFWNAKTGECFYFDKTLEYNKFLCFTVSKNFKSTKANSDQICPLKSVGSIITFDNVYVNIQSKCDPGLIDFDITNASNWMKFLTEDSMKKYFPKGVQSIQKDIEYSEPSESERDSLKNAIKDYIKNEIEKVRGEIADDGNPLVTNWEFTATEQIEKILESYEVFCFESTKSGINVSIYIYNGDDCSSRAIMRI